MAGGPHDVPEISVEALKQRIDTGQPVVLLDVREPMEWDIANLEPYGARLIPMGEIPDRLGELDKAADIVVYCRTGNRSAGVARYMKALGFQRVWNLQGGINAWAERIDPDVHGY